MIDCVSVANMRLSDRLTIESGVSSIELIRRAASGVFRSVDWKAPVAIVAGSGNNGADGFALAELFCERCIACTVFTVSNRLHEDAAYYAQQCENHGVPVQPFERGCLKDFGTVVDCMLGTGFSGGLKNSYENAIHEINASGAFVVSVDINSGMNGDSGMGDAVVCSDHTVTVGFVKRGLILPHAGKYMKKLTCIDIGIPLVEKEAVIYALDEQKEQGRDGYVSPPWLDMDIKRFAE